MTRDRWGRTTIALAVALALTACTGDDDSADDTVATPPETAATDPPPTDPPTTSTTTTTQPPTTTIDIEALKAQIAADYVRSQEAREELARNPSLDSLEERAATMAAPGSKSYNDLIAFVRGMVDRGERVVPGNPDYSEVIVESVDLVGDATAQRAVVTACNIFNEARVGPSGTPLGATGELYAVRIRQTVDRTANGWLPSDVTEGVTSTTGATACPPA